MTNTHKMRKFARDYVENYPSIKKVYDSIAGARRMGSEVSVSVYVSAIKKFIKYLDYSNPEEALEAMQNGSVNAEEKVDGFIDYALDSLKLSHSTTRSHTFGIKKWLELSGVEVNWKKIDLPTATETVEEDRAPTKEDLKKLLNHAGSARDRFVIFAATSSGLRIGTLLSLKVGDVDLSYPDVARLTVERRRGRKFSSRGRAAGKLFVTWITPEAKQGLEAYLLEREGAGEVLTSESPLISDYNYKGSFISVEAYEKVWYRILKRAGLAQKSNRYYMLHLHTLRKYFRSNCIGVDASYREKWMGHKGLYLDMSYFRAEETLHLMEYRKTITHLTIYPIKMEHDKLRQQMILDFAKLQGFTGEKLKRVEDALAKAKDVDEAIEEFRKLEDEGAEEFRKLDDESANNNRSVNRSKHIVAHGEREMLQRLEEGYRLVQPLQEEKFLLELH